MRSADQLSIAISLFQRAGGKLHHHRHAVSVLEMTPLNGWDGPECIEEGLFRYSRYLSWIRLYIEINGEELRGGIRGTSSDLEIAREEGIWKRYAISPAWTNAGEPTLILRRYTTWEMVYERISEGVRLDEEIETIEDLAIYLERYNT